MHKAHFSFNITTALRGTGRAKDLKGNVDSQAYTEYFFPPVETLLQLNINKAAGMVIC